MSTRQAGNPGVVGASNRANTSRFYMLRLARKLAKRAAQQRQSGAPQPIKATAHKRQTLSLRPRSASTETEARRMARLSVAADFLAAFIAILKDTPDQADAHRCMVSPWGDGSLDQAAQALRAGDPQQAVKMLAQATEQAREPVSVESFSDRHPNPSGPDVARARCQRADVLRAIRSTRMLMSNPDHALDLNELVPGFLLEDFAGPNKPAATARASTEGGAA